MAHLKLSRTIADLAGSEEILIRSFNRGVAICSDIAISVTNTQFKFDGWLTNAALAAFETEAQGSSKCSGTNIQLDITTFKIDAVHD